MYDLGGYTGTIYLDTGRYPFKGNFTPWHGDVNVIRTDREKLICQYRTHTPQFTTDTHQPTLLYER